MFDFQGKVVLAVGGAGYLCSPACEGFAARGAAIVVTDLDEKKAQDFAREIEAKYSTRALGLKCDVGDEDSIRNAVSTTMEKFGRLDTVVNAAYKGSHGQGVDDMPHDAFDDAAHVQLSGTFLLAREAAKVMESGASMVFFSVMAQ